MSEVRSVKCNGLIVNEKYLPLLRAARLDSYEALLNYAGEADSTAIKKNRTILRFRCGPEQFFLKRHGKCSWKEGLKRILFGRQRSSGLAEWKNILRLKSAGLPIPDPVATGERLLFGMLERDSLCVTQAVEGKSLEAALPESFAPGRRSEWEAKKCVGGRVGRLVRELHCNGFCHKDLYLCHIFFCGEIAGEFELVLIDLQRVRRIRTIRNRRTVKDIAALHYSSLCIPAITNTLRLGCFLSYWGSSRLDPSAKRFLRRVLRKSRRIARHTEKHPSVRAGGRIDCEPIDPGESMC